MYLLLALPLIPNTTLLSMKRVCNQTQAPATTRLRRGDLQWADPPNLLQLQQLV